MGAVESCPTAGYPNKNVKTYRPALPLVAWPTYHRRIADVPLTYTDVLKTGRGDIFDISPSD